MTTKRIKIDSAFKTVVLVVAVIAFIPVAWFVVRWCMAGSAIERSPDLELAIYLTQIAPDDPQIHRIAAKRLEESFDPADIERALREYEIAAALAPENYQLWLDLGRARERAAGPESGESALRRALLLAPHYSRVQWALGNNLLRQGRIDEAFAEITQAVAGDQTFAGPAAVAAWQFFEGDIARIKKAMDGSTKFDAALAALLARENKFDQALDLWRSLPTDEKTTSLAEVGRNLYDKLLEAKRFRDAAFIFGDISGVPATIGEVTNGGFEKAVRPEGSKLFDWQIADGLRPQIVLNNSQSHGGNHSLLLIFSSTDSADFRSVSQAVAVEPARSYELELFYRSELKTSAIFRWEVAKATTGERLAVTDPIEVRSDWTRTSARFTAPADSDGVVIRLVREGCGQICPVSGNLWFDDVSLR